MVDEEVSKLMDFHGPFSDDDPKWNAQARLEEAIRDKFGLEAEAESTIRNMITEPLKAWLAREAEKGR